MARRLQVSRAGKGLGYALQVWWAMRRQKRRRRGTAVALPQITLALVSVQEADPVTWSPVLDVGVEGGVPPDGFLVKVWQQLDEVGDFIYRGAIGQAGLFTDEYGLPTGHTALYRAQLATEDDSVVGPWTPDVFVDSP